MFKKYLLTTSILSVLILLGCYHQSKAYGWYSKGRKGKSGYNPRFDSRNLQDTRTYNNGIATTTDSLLNEEKIAEAEKLKEVINGLTDRGLPKSAQLYERYTAYTENEWVKALEESKSTFSIDVDNASYTNFRHVYC